ncbi:MAG: hypothetical protein K6C69_01315 [Lachnospiraceae bacterium]|nr:hypothetical protein [Lachnospiraceae bacterium]
MLLELKSKVQNFLSAHPKFFSFIGVVGKQGIREGSIIEIKVTSPDGTEYTTNLRLSAEDLELLELFKNFKQS